MEPVRVVWAGVIVVVQPSPGAGAPPAAPWSAQGALHAGAWGGAGHDLVLHQVSAWLTGLRQGVQAPRPLPAFHFAPPPARADVAKEEAEAPLPGFYL